MKTRIYQQRGTVALMIIFWATLCRAQSGSIDKNNFIGASEFHTKIQELSTPQILDARTKEEFEQAHIPGAIKSDPATDDLEKNIATLQKTKPVFVYSIQTGRSSRTAEVLRKAGFERVYVLSPGISAWIGSGYPVEASVTNPNRIDTNDFRLALSSQDYVLVDFGSNYCPPCKKVIPVLDSLNARPKNDIKTIKVDIEANPEIIGQFKITALPTIILYNNGSPVWKKIGVPSVEEIVAAQLNLNR